jgi:DNA-binding CsgD family transcriptional regulator
MRTRVFASDGSAHAVTIVRLLGVDERFLASRGAPHPGHEGVEARRRLTPAQRRVCELLVTGATLAEIASALDVSAETVKSHTKAIYARLDVSTRVELVRVLRDE